jgi:hypothetical protein
MTLIASRADRERVTDQLRQCLADVESEVFEIANEEVGVLDEYLSCDRYDLEIALFEQASAFHMMLIAYRTERARLAADHAEMEAEADHLDRINAGLGYGHLQRERI